MDYRYTSKTGYKISALSYGCMRFADDESAVAAIHKAVESGVNYFDVAPLYCGGQSERRLGLALKGIDRSKVIITAKSSPGTGGNEVQEHCDPEAGFGIRTSDQVRAQIERSMKIIGVDHLDMYQFWAGHSDAIIDEGFKAGGFMDGVLKAHSEGLFYHIGLTTHADAESTIKYLERFPFSLVIIPFHARDISRAKAIEYCAERGIAVIAMNPLAGGGLAKRNPVMDTIAAEMGCETMTEAAMRFVANYPGITSALAGMTYDRHVTENVDALAKGPLSKDSAITLPKKLAELYSNVKHFCTACGYCGQCPEGISIPSVLQAYTNLLVPSTSESAKASILSDMQKDSRAYDPSLCQACQICISKCPNKLPISEMMAAASDIWPD